MSASSQQLRAPRQRKPRNPPPSKLTSTAAPAATSRPARQRQVLSPPPVILQETRRPSRVTAIPKALTPAVLNASLQQTGRSLPNNGPRVDFGRNPYAEYLRCLIDPAGNSARIPDAYPRPTAVFTTEQSFDVPLLVDAYSGGKFSFALQPILGDTSTPTHYKCAVSNAARMASTQTTWDQVNWSDPSAYLTIAGNGADVRIDPNSGVLTATPPTFFGDNFSVASGSTDLGPLALMSNMPTGQTPSVDNTATYKFSSPSAINPYFPALSAAQNPYPGAVVIPFGAWNVSVSAKFQLTTASSTGTVAIGFNEFLDAGGINRSVNPVAIQQPQTVSPSLNTTYTAAATFQFVSVPGNNIFAPMLSQQQTGTNFAINTGIVGTVSATTITIAPTNFASSSTYQSGGIIEEIRPVAMATLVTYMGTTLNNGGEIASNYLDSTLMTNNFFQSNTAGLGQLQNINNLRSTPGKHDGPIKDGTYCIWAPYQSNDLSFRSPSEMNSYRYPGIVVSGYFSPDAAVVAPQSVLRVMVYTCYEYTTKFTCIETKSIPGSTATTEDALLILKQIKFATTNKGHLENIRRSLRRGWEWYKSNSAAINPALGALGALLI